ncbi:MAG TPA: pilus assembly protein N-terminal domain-containing protein [Candidatus Acidoferrales bacterium]|nr:pilus assembly protein N-terminal domain-containing protein [Candidatus Acidoferrales bacterium]HXK02931.1 pilus assembly protein N-terminal domain-containing protein [Verrucomicrobiae bacterium]
MRFAVQLLCAAACLAQTTQPQAREITLLEGRGELLTFKNDITKVAISEPKIADTVVLSPREVMVNAKTPGRATLLVWETGADPARWEIQVTRDSSDWDTFARSIRETAGTPITITGTGETIVLSGKVHSTEDAKKLASMAQTRAKTVINLLEAPPPAEPRQVLLQVKFAAINRVALSQIGFNLFSTNPAMIGAASTQQFTSPRFSPLTTGPGVLPTSTVNFSDLLNLFVFRPDLNIGATIKALQERDLLQILAEPNLITLEGKDASFLAGGQFPFPTITTTPTGGTTAPVITVQFKPFGVKLDFTPTITPQGAIDLKVAPEVSSLDYTNAVVLQGYTIPALSSRRADTEVILKDGESFAIAGLIDNRVIETVAKLPGLGDLPVLGHLFRSRSTDKTTDELLVVVTPHFVKPLTPEEKAKLPDMPATFLPTVQEEKAKKNKKNSKSSSTVSPDDPQFVGPRGQQIPKQ